MSEKWRVVGGFHDNFYGVQMGDWGGFMLPQKEGAQERAERIVLACNYFEEMKEALKEAVLFYTEELEYIGGCDHEAGICVCGIKNDMARLEDLLRRIEEAERV